MSEIMKQKIREYWDAEPCGTGGVAYSQGTVEFYEEVARKRYRKELFISKFAEFEKWRGRKVLEVGCGAGSDLVRFIQAGALVTGVDLSPRSVELTRKRLQVYSLPGEVVVSDAEKLPFPDAYFDMVYSCGVLHHTPSIEKAIAEVWRVLKVGGEIRVMLYHKPSLVCLQMWMLYGFMKGRPFRKIDDIFYHHHESIGTKVYTAQEVRGLFSEFRDLGVTTEVAVYDVRYAREKFLPAWVKRIVPNSLGWNVLIRGRK